jgi:hypothetical protein
MLEVASYGLTGLAAVLVMASCLAYRDEFSLRRKRPVNLVNGKDWPPSLRSRQRSAEAFCSCVSNRSVPKEAFHG